MDKIKQDLCRQEGEIILFDNSALNNPRYGALCRRLYNGKSGLRDITEEEMKNRLHSLNILNEYMAKTNFCALEKSAVEVKAFLDSLNIQIEYIRREINLEIRHKREDISEGREVIVCLLQEYSDSVYSFLRSLGGIDPTRKFNEKEKDIYLKMLSLTEREENQSRSPDCFPRKRKLGDILGTDNKIIASAFTIAYSSPVNVLSMDERLCGKMLRVYEYIVTGAGTKNGILEIPRETINFTRPYY